MDISSLAASAAGSPAGSSDAVFQPATMKNVTNRTINKLSFFIFPSPSYVVEIRVMVSFHPGENEPVYGVHHTVRNRQSSIGFFGHYLQKGLIFEANKNPHGQRV
jgi:hypothetical protein